MAPPTNGPVLSPPHKRPGEQDPADPSSPTPAQPAKRVKVEVSSNMAGAGKFETTSSNVAAPTKPATTPATTTPTFTELATEFGAHLASFGALETRIKNRDLEAVPEFEANFAKTQELLQQVMTTVCGMGDLHIKMAAVLGGKELCRTGVFDLPPRISLFGPKVVGGGGTGGIFSSGAGVGGSLFGSGSGAPLPHKSPCEMTMGEFVETYGGNFLGDVVRKIKTKYEDKLRTELMKVR